MKTLQRNSKLFKLTAVYVPSYLTEISSPAESALVHAAESLEGEGHDSSGVSLGSGEEYIPPPSPVVDIQPGGDVKFVKGNQDGDDEKKVGDNQQ